MVRRSVKPNSQGEKVRPRVNYLSALLPCLSRLAQHKGTISSIKRCASGSCTMVWIALILLAFASLALLCAMLLMRPASAPAADVEPMRHALERRIREGAEFRL
jgi:hypothetical protein